MGEIAYAPGWRHLGSRPPGPGRIRLLAVNDSTANVPGASAVGLATFTPDGRVLDTWYPSPALLSATDQAR